MNKKIFLRFFSADPFTFQAAPPFDSQELHNHQLVAFKHPTQADKRRLGGNGSIKAKKLALLISSTTLLLTPYLDSPSELITA
ncbi:hypothetical protein PSH85_20465 [Pseudomonas simiae]|jgi:hypothetical protein|uniref:hypothetical protein n=1 Tax=Pseudomonas simiae TaxID=321846 RepID=UPI002735E48F|nr:hypothetical protein [Pseudomonas simiae]WLG32702.1 hypothetical protein PSH82_20435 [Pseudomonas simiae]WLI22693.1 hypothetical protein PSH85_20465 [Pseudomonas simiae]